MNGAVFQTSAKIMTAKAVAVLAEPDAPRRPAGPSADSIELAKPRCGSKIERQSRPLPKVSTAHGTSTVARRSARPRNARCIASANAMPEHQLYRDRDACEEEASSGTRPRTRVELRAVS